MIGSKSDGSNCSSCDPLRESIAIDDPLTLERVLSLIADNLRDGTLVHADYWPTGRIRLSQPDFREISPSGPWPDYLEYYFACHACGQLYRLSAETYRGTGGSWSRYSV